MKKKVLDITNVKCPVSFLKTKEFIKANVNKKKLIIMKGKDDFKLLSNSLKKNFKLKIITKKDDVFEIELM